MYNKKGKILAPVKITEQEYEYLKDIQRKMDFNTFTKVQKFAFRYLLKAFGYNINNQ